MTLKKPPEEVKRKIDDLAGKIFRGLRAIRTSGRSSNGGYVWEVECVLCGKKGERNASNLKAGRAVCSCSSRAGGLREARPIQPTLVDEMLSKPWRVS